MAGKSAFAATWRMSTVSPSSSSLSNGGVRRRIHLFARLFLLRPISGRAFSSSISPSSCSSHFFGSVILTREPSYLLPRRDFSVSAMATAEVAYIKSSIPEDEEAFLLAMQLATASILPMVLKAAIELDLLEMMAKAGSGAYVTPTELASMLPTSNPDAPSMLDRILRVLATYSVLKCQLKELPNGQVERTYSLTRVCKFLTKNEDGASIAPLSILFQDKVFMESWYYLKNTVLDGQLPFKHAFGVDFYDYHAVDPRYSTIFNQAMEDHSTIFTKIILENYNGFEGLNTLVDVGGGTGASLNAIMSKYPTITGINFDLPNVVQDAPTYNTGVKHVGGDMFVSVPKGDAIFMKWICHNWSDDKCLRLLTNCYEALTENGKVVIADAILPELPETALATKIVLHLDIAMLAQTPGGKERTEKEFQTIAKLAGFKSFNKVCCVFSFWIMELCK